MTKTNKYSILLVKGLAKPMARILLTLCVMNATSCLVPQDPNYPGELLPKRNTAPDIVSILPQQRFTVTLGVLATCKPMPKISLTVHEPDINDVTRVRWYVDPTVDANPVASSPANYGGSTERVFEAPAAVTNKLNSFAMDGKIHLVQAYITDSDFSDSYPPTASRAPLTLPDSGVVNDYAAIIDYTWFVKTDPCP